MTTHKSCPVCRKSMEAHPNRVYCSNACRQRAKRRRELAIPEDTPRVRGRYKLRRIAAG